ncbi:hypothetical protein KFK09_014883 [Dendrobium nobile]|uniref:Tf2-1-like SH3-like domain-containing protein n=1 Tax=Dendrobium nobile TaxID=94219 RepID=A0A8T3B301_DENNO|nr:hypothetical protein KFK09_014883 [Dendrobium nobile]
MFVEFQVGDFVFVKVSPMKGVSRFGQVSKLSPRYVGPFEISERIGKSAYRLLLSDSMPDVHNVFHVSTLRKWVSDSGKKISADEVEIQENLAYKEEPELILAYDVRKLRNKEIPMVKVQWKHRTAREATWEKESNMRRIVQDDLDRPGTISGTSAPECTQICSRPIEDIVQADRHCRKYRPENSSGNRPGRSNLERESRGFLGKSGFSGDAELFSSEETVRDIVVRKVLGKGRKSRSRFLSSDQYRTIHVSAWTKLPNYALIDQEIKELQEEAKGGKFSALPGWQKGGSCKGFSA